MPPTQLSAFHPSPKRKRDTAPYAPLLSTSLRTTCTPGASPEPAGPDSPGNVVADRLQGMTLAAAPTMPMSPNTPMEDAVRKKPKLEATSGASVTSAPLEALNDEDMASWGLETMQEATVKMPHEDGSLEIPETPQSLARAQPPRAFADVDALTRSVMFAASPTELAAQQSIRRGPTSKPGGRPPQPRSRKKSPSPPLASLTWKDSEITGHLADPSTDPDDDGTGINGIGFKPTPALAYARAQRRRQQLNDWRARETKEARAKRSQRRSRGVGGAGTPSREGTVEREAPAKEADTERRAVRFAI